MYADDLVILSESKTGLQAKLDALENFCNDWCLTININKTKVMIFNKAGRLIKGNFKVQNKEVECVSTYRYLVRMGTNGKYAIRIFEYIIRIYSDREIEISTRRDVPKVCCERCEELPST